MDFECYSLDEVGQGDGQSIVEMTKEEPEGVRCEVCGKEIPRGEACYQVYSGYFGEDEREFITQDLVAYTHEGCLPLTPTM